jgi:hypothetical protein
MSENVSAEENERGENQEKREQEKITKRDRKRKRKKKEEKERKAHTSSYEVDRSIENVTRNNGRPKVSPEVPEKRKVEHGKADWSNFRISKHDWKKKKRNTK